MPAPRKDFCGTCRRPLDGDNLYVSPKGRRGCVYCREQAKVRYKARERARVLAAVARRTRSDRDRFAALAAAIRAELVALPEDQRGPYLPGPGRELTKAEKRVTGFAGRRVTRDQVGPLTGLSDGGAASTIGQHVRRARREHAAGTATPSTMPLPASDGTWQAGELALWRAATWPKYGLGNRGRWDGDEHALRVVERAVAEHGRAVSPSMVLEAVAGTRQPAEHVGVSRARVRRLVGENRLNEVKPGVPDGAELAVLESDRWDGLVTAAQLAGWFQVTSQALTAAVRRGELTEHGRQGRQRLFDPAQVAARRDGKPGPVDKNHPLALPG